LEHIYQKYETLHFLCLSHMLIVYQSCNLITRYDLYDAWRKLHPNKKRYSFQRGNSKSRIDFIKKCFEKNRKIVFYHRIDLEQIY
jgi:hypothetical protein